MIELSLLVQIFEVCIIPLLGVLTTYFIKWLNAHMDEIKAKKDDLTYQKYMTLLTGGLVLLDEYEDNENIIKNNTYTARYLNEVIPYWDTDNYY